MSKVARSLGSVALARLISAAGAFTLFWIIARLAGPEALGGYAVALSVFLISQQLPLAGLHIAVARDVSNGHRPQQDVVQATLPIALCVAALLLIGILIGAAVSYPASLQAPFAFIALAAIPAAWTTTAEAVLIGQQRMSLIARVTVAENLGRTAVCATLALLHAPLWTFFAALLAGRIVTALVYQHLLEMRAGRSWQSRDYAVQLPTFLGIALFAAFASRIDMLVLGQTAGLEEAGTYAPAAKLYEFFLMAPSILATALFPVFSRAAAVPGALAPLLMRTWRGLLWTVTPAVVPGMLLAAPTIGFLFGPQYAEAGQVLGILTVAAAIVALDQCLTIGLLARGAQRWDALSLGVGITFGTTALIVLTPRYGAIGAAWAVVSMTGLQLAFRLLFATPVLGIERIRSQLILAALPPVAVAIATAGVGVLLKPYGLIAAVVATAGITAAGIVLAGVLSWRRALQQLRGKTARLTA